MMGCLGGHSTPPTAHHVVIYVIQAPKQLGCIDTHVPHYMSPPLAPLPGMATMNAPHMYAHVGMPRGQVFSPHSPHLHAPSMPCTNPSGGTPTLCTPRRARLAPKCGKHIVHSPIMIPRLVACLVVKHGQPTKQDQVSQSCKV